MRSTERFAILVAAVFFGATAFVAGCKDQGPTGTEVSDIVFPASNVSYHDQVDPLFQQRCALSGCHAGSNPQAGLDLTAPSYDALRNHFPTLVIAGEDSLSILVERIEGTLPPRMPLNRTPLTDNQIAGIRTWIREGALNN
jgi:hypothetical protein